MLGKRAASAGLAVGLVFIIIIAAVVYLAINGTFNINSILGNNNQNASSGFSTTVTTSVTALAGRSAQVSLSYFNPFPETVNAIVSANSLSSGVVGPAVQSKSITMPASMQAATSASFNFTCGTGSANQAATIVYNVYVSGYTQNLTTDAVTTAYGYATPQQTQAQQNTVPGFLSIVANPPAPIVYGGSGSAQGSITISFTPAVGSNAGVYTGGQSPTPNGQLSSITIKINNSEGGIASAQATVNGAQKSFTTSGNYLALTLNNLDIGTTNAQISLPVELTAAQTSTSTYIPITISAVYNYQYTISPGTLVSCQ